jgi:hypothetical protein
LRAEYAKSRWRHLVALGTATDYRWTPVAPTEEEKYRSEPDSFERTASSGDGGGQVGRMGLGHRKWPATSCSAIFDPSLGSIPIPKNRVPLYERYRDFFDPTPEQEKVVLIDAATHELFTAFIRSLNSFNSANKCWH